MKISDLEQFGFTQKEAKVYVSTLELGSGSAQKISQKAGIPKSTTADVLKELVLRGLVSTSKIKSKTIFSASNPVMLEERIYEQSKVVQKLMPELQAIFNSSSSKPRIRFYEDKKGIGTVLTELYKEADSLIFMGNADAVYKTFPEYFPMATEKRIEKKIPSRGIVVDGKVAREFKNGDIGAMRKTHILPAEAATTALGWIWKNKFVIFNTKGSPSVVVIEDEEITNHFRMMFEMIFKYVPEVSVGGTE